jgi:hypothetical protein
MPKNSRRGVHRAKLDRNIVPVRGQITRVSEYETDLFYPYPRFNEAQQFPVNKVSYISNNTVYRPVIPTQTPSGSEHEAHLRFCRHNSRGSVYKGHADRGVVMCEDPNFRKKDVGTSASETSHWEVLKDTVWAPQDVRITVNFQANAASSRSVTVKPGLSQPRYFPMNPYILHPCKATNNVLEPNEAWFDRVFQDTRSIVGKFTKTTTQEVLELPDSEAAINERRKRAKEISGLFSKIVSSVPISSGSLPSASPSCPRMPDQVSSRDDSSGGLRDSNESIEVRGALSLEQGAGATVAETVDGDRTSSNIDMGKRVRKSSKHKSKRVKKQKKSKRHSESS